MLFFLRGVLATDVWQSLLMFSAVIAVIISGCVNVGFQEIFKR